jgi:hypothetical protein
MGGMSRRFPIAIIIVPIRFTFMLQSTRSCEEIMGEWKAIVNCRIADMQKIEKEGIDNL